LLVNTTITEYGIQGCIGSDEWRTLGYLRKDREEVEQMFRQHFSKPGYRMIERSISVVTRVLDLEPVC
jgi:hypothetical protein